MVDRGSRRRADQEARRIQELLGRLEEAYPDADCALHHQNAYQLLVATILSAQCTDVRVNQVTPALFKRYPDAAALARARPAKLEEIIRSTGFFRNKARNLIGAARTLVREFGGRMPRDLESLMRLPGVARKTANVVLGTAFGIASGVVVDTHVRRLSQRLGLTLEQDPVKIERALMEKLPAERWIRFSHQLIHHGRRVCRARKPLCPECSLADLCPSAERS